MSTLAERPLPNAIRQTTPTNCFRACVAMLLGVAIDDTPVACDGESWDWDAFQDWLGERGLQAVEMTFANGGTLYPVRRPIPCIISGKSPRGDGNRLHAVVGQFVGLDGFVLTHDPHPSDLWIDGEPTHVTFIMSVGRLQ